MQCSNWVRWRTLTWNHPGPSSNFLALKANGCESHTLVYFILGLSHLAAPHPKAGPQNAIILVFNVNQVPRSSSNKF